MEQEKTWEWGVALMDGANIARIFPTIYKTREEALEMRNWLTMRKVHLTYMVVRREIGPWRSAASL
jgi:hypothetical protein